MGIHGWYYFRALRVSHLFIFSVVGSLDQLDYSVPTHNYNANEVLGPVQLRLLCGGDLLESFAVPGLWAEEDVSTVYFVCPISSMRWPFAGAMLDSTRVVQSFVFMQSGNAILLTGAFFSAKLDAGPTSQLLTWHWPGLGECPVKLVFTS